MQTVSCMLGEHLFHVVHSQIGSLLANTFSDLTPLQIEDQGKCSSAAVVKSFAGGQANKTVVKWLL